MTLTLEERIRQIDMELPALIPLASSAFLAERLAEYTEKLVDANDEQTRGRAKELRDLINLPAALQEERSHLAVALSEQSDAT